MPTDRFKNERGQPDDKKRDDWRFTGDPKEYAKYKDQVAYDLGKLLWADCSSSVSVTASPDMLISTPWRGAFARISIC